MTTTIEEELFDRCYAIATATDSGPSANRQMHETLVLACAEGARTAEMGFGSLFAQVDRLCRRCGVAQSDRMEIQTMRRHSNRRDSLPREELMYDVRALCIFISAVLAVSVPSKLTRIIPATGRPADRSRTVNVRYMRCVVDKWDERYIHATADTDGGHVRVDYGEDADMAYLRRLLREGMQLNLLDCHAEGRTVRPGLVVVEPDFLVDISSLAACFTSYGHHPLAYTINRMRPKANSQAILLGNFASCALDGIINNPDFNLNETIARSFREQALQFCACPDFNPDKFVSDARRQADNLKEIWSPPQSPRRGEAGASEAVHIQSSPLGGIEGGYILEPSFVCERLGLQGRADLMTTDFRLLVEQKSGRNRALERPSPPQSPQGGEAGASEAVQDTPDISIPPSLHPPFGGTEGGLGEIEGGRGPQGLTYNESHYVQLLLYYGVLRYNFGYSDGHVDMRLLYSRYPARQGLIAVNFYRGLFREAIRLRNRIVAGEYYMARHGFGSIAGRLSADIINERPGSSRFFEQYARPEIEDVTAPLHNLPRLERAYFERMMTFVYREQWAAKVGVQEGVSSSAADLWNMPLDEKIETGNIILAVLKAPTAPCSSEGGKPYAVEYLSLIPTPPAAHDDVSKRLHKTVGTRNPEGGLASSTFRRGDMVYVYKYSSEPDIRRSLLHKGTIEATDGEGLTVRLNNPQRNPEIFTEGTYAVEHSSSDIGATSAIRGLHTFVTAPAGRRALLLGQRAPRNDTARKLSRPYNPDYDGVLLKAMQALDYFLLVGPPGTGKTSMALRFIVEEELRGASGGTEGGLGSVLLMSYTNRAIDEICSMLCDAGIGFLRIGNGTSCDPRFRDRLLDMALGGNPTLDGLKQRIADTRVIVSTTSTMLSRPFLFELKHFTLAVIDEASQILEPNIVGLLAAHHDGVCDIDRFILIGDHKQLPAVVQQREEDSRVSEPELRRICLTDCRNSLFERLLAVERTAGRTSFVGVLRKQGRMHPDIAAFPNRMFYARERLEPVPCEHQTETSLRYDLPSEDATDDLLKSRRMIFIPSEPCRGMAASDKVNISEARIVADIARRIHRFYGPRFDPDRTLGVIVPYRNQITAIRNEIDRLGIGALEGISIDTVERYQGSQRDVIVYSFTVQTRSQMDFLTSCRITEDGHTIDRKLNVAITRARRQMIMTGNTDTLKHNAVFAELMKECNIRT